MKVTFLENFTYRKLEFANGLLVMCQTSKSVWNFGSYRQKRMLRIIWGIKSETKSSFWILIRVLLNLHEPSEHDTSLRFLQTFSYVLTWFFLKIKSCQFGGQNQSIFLKIGCHNSISKCRNTPSNNSVNKFFTMFSFLKIYHYFVN